MTRQLIKCPSKPRQLASMHNTRTLELAQLNVMPSFLMLHAKCWGLIVCFGKLQRIKTKTVYLAIFWIKYQCLEHTEHTDELKDLGYMAEAV